MPPADHPQPADGLLGPSRANISAAFAGVGGGAWKLSAGPIVNRTFQGRGEREPGGRAHETPGDGTGNDGNGSACDDDSMRPLKCWSEPSRLRVVFQEGILAAGLADEPVFHLARAWGQLFYGHIGSTLIIWAWKSDRAGLSKENIPPRRGKRGDIIGTAAPSR